MAPVDVRRMDAREVISVWSDSLHASVFTHPEVLGRFFDRVDWWGAYRRDTCVAAWPVPVDEDERPISSGWFYFVGPIWANGTFPPPAHRSLSATLATYTRLIDALVDQYGRFVASLPPPQDDVRAFTWWRYEEGAPISVAPRYSARIEGLAGRTMDSLLADMRQLRRREFRRDSVVSGIQWSNSVEVEELGRLYLQRAPGKLSEFLPRAQRLLSLVSSGWGAVEAARSLDGDLLSAVVLLEDHRMANVVINSIDDAWRNSGLSVHTMIRAIEMARARGLKAFDFNGANSPNRGDDKHSYGARPVLYFDVSFTP